MSNICKGWVRPWQTHSLRDKGIIVLQLRSCDWISLFDLQAVIYKHSEEEKDEEDGNDAVNGLCQNKNSGALRSGGGFLRLAVLFITAAVFESWLDADQRPQAGRWLDFAQGYVIGEIPCVGGAPCAPTPPAVSPQPAVLMCHSLCPGSPGFARGGLQHWLQERDHAGRRFDDWWPVPRTPEGRGHRGLWEDQCAERHPETGSHANGIRWNQQGWAHPSWPQIGSSYTGHMLEGHLCSGAVSRVCQGLPHQSRWQWVHVPWWILRHPRRCPSGYLRGHRRILQRRLHSGRDNWKQKVALQCNNYIFF